MLRISSLLGYGYILLYNIHLATENGILHRFNYQKILYLGLSRSCFKKSMNVYSVRLFSAQTIHLNKFVRFSL